ncbi:MAG: hypothetical protein ACI9LY_001414 [Arenicella sp.]
MLWVHPQPDGKSDIDELLGPLVEELAYQEFGRNHRFVTANKTIDVLRDKPERFIYPRIID